VSAGRHPSGPSPTAPLPRDVREVTLHTPLTVDECIARLKSLEPRTMREWQGGGIPLRVDVHGRVVRLRPAEFARFGSFTAELVPMAEGTRIEGGFGPGSPVIGRLATRVVASLPFVVAAGLGILSGLASRGVPSFVGAAAFTTVAVVIVIRTLLAREEPAHREILEHVAPVLEATPTSAAAAALLSRTTLGPSGP
jgi:hypothetical protein